MRPFSTTIPLVGINRTVTATLDLGQPAPVGGATFDLVVVDTTIATVSPASITIPEGGLSATFELTGGNIIGSTTINIDGNATAYLDVGLTFLIHENLQLDGRVGQGFNGLDEDWFTGIGLVTRI